MAAVPSEVICHDRQETLSYLSEHPDEMMGFMEMLAKRVIAQRTRLELVQIRNAEERLMAYLRLECDQESGVFEIPKDVKDLAGDLGMAHETLYRTLRKLQDKEVVGREGNFLQILIV